MQCDVLAWTPTSSIRNPPILTGGNIDVNVQICKVCSDSVRKRKVSCSLKRKVKKPNQQSTGSEDLILPRPHFQLWSHLLLWLHLLLQPHVTPRLWNGLKVGKKHYTLRSFVQHFNLQLNTEHWHRHQVFNLNIEPTWECPCFPEIAQSQCSLTQLQQSRAIQVVVKEKTAFNHIGDY